MEERGGKRLKRVNIIVDVEIFGDREGLHLLLDGEEGLAYLVDGCLGLYFEHEFADVEGLDAGNRGTVGAEDSVAEDGAETIAHICCQMVEQLVVAMAKINIDEAVERWIVEEFAFFHLGAEHLPKVSLGDLADDVGIGSGEAEGADATGLQTGHEVFVDESTVDHRDHVKHGAVGDAATAYHLCLYAQRSSHLGGPASSAVDQNLPARDGGEVTKQLRELCLVLNDGTADFNNKKTLETLPQPLPTREGSG